MLEIAIHVLYRDQGIEFCFHPFFMLLNFLSGRQNTANKWKREIIGLGTNDDFRLGMARGWEQACSFPFRKEKRGMLRSTDTTLDDNSRRSCVQSCDRKLCR